MPRAAGLLPAALTFGGEPDAVGQSKTLTGEIAFIMASSVAPAEPVAAPIHGPQRMNIVIVGHVDHGKSTVIGRLLADTNSLPEGKLEQVRASCERSSKPFEYAFLLDALKDEQAQGITIDAARVFFKTATRPYLILDAPGHIEFLKNMITGAARAEAAILVIDAQEGVQENSRRHGYMVSLLGIRQLAVLVNKMDLVGWDRAVYERIVREYGAFLEQVGIRPQCFIPASGRGGDNIATRSANLPWYDGPTVLEALDGFHTEPSPVDSPFRMPVQGVYKFTKQGDDRRIVAGTIDSGAVLGRRRGHLLSLRQEEPGEVHRGLQSGDAGAGRRPARRRDSRCRSRSTSRAARSPRSKGSPGRRSPPGSG